MVYQAKALLLANNASEIINCDRSNAQQAGKCFREASGIMSFLHSTLITRWNAPATAPIECYRTFCQFLDYFFQAKSDQMAYVKAIQQPGVPPSLLARLSANVVKGMDFSLDFFIRNCAPQRLSVDPQLELHMGFTRELYVGLRAFHQGMDLAASQHTGKAIGVLRCAQARLCEQRGAKEYTPELPGLPKVVLQQNAPLRQAVRDLCIAMADNCQRAEKENQMIYFETIPRDETEMPDLPEGVSLNLPAIPVTPPPTEETILPFRYDESLQPSIFTRVSNIFSSKA